ncbi:MAG: TIGR02444 family protein [Neomegalonema sp.]|nr:TIGR02444 family protein [Neomegalonema sp.]
MPVNQTIDKVLPQKAYESPAGAAAASSFWQFSCRFYATDGVAAHCLELQDRFGWDVNLALFALWLAAEHRPIAHPALAQAAAFAAAWRSEKVEPLRRLRRALKAEADGDPEINSFRERIKTLELEAERMQQQRLAQFAPPPFAPPPCGREAPFAAHAREAMAQFAQLQRISEHAEQSAVLDALVAAADAFVRRDGATSSASHSNPPRQA